MPCPRLIPKTHLTYNCQGTTWLSLQYLENTIGKQLHALNYINLILEDLHQWQKKFQRMEKVISIIFSPPRTGELKHWMELSQCSIHLYISGFYLNVFLNMLMLISFRILLTWLVCGSLRVICVLWLLPACKRLVGEIWVQTGKSLLFLSWVFRVGSNQSNYGNKIPFPFFRVLT